MYMCVTLKFLCKLDEFIIIESYINRVLTTRVEQYNDKIQLATLIAKS